MLLIGGSSENGKTVFARQLSRRFGLARLQVDDVRLALQRITGPEQQPALHFFVSTPEVWKSDPEVLCERLIDVGRVVSRALEIVIAHHVATNDPIVLEGDAILPSLATQRRFADLEAGDRVRSLLLFEPDEDAILANMRARRRGFQ